MSKKSILPPAAGENGVHGFSPFPGLLTQGTTRRGLSGGGLQLLLCSLLYPPPLYTNLRSRTKCWNPWLLWGSFPENRAKRLSSQRSEVAQKSSSNVGEQEGRRARGSSRAQD